MLEGNLYSLKQNGIQRFVKKIHLIKLVEECVLWLMGITSSCIFRELIYITRTEVNKYH